MGERTDNQVGIDRDTDRQIDGKSDRQPGWDRQTHRQTNGWEIGQTTRWDRQTHRQTAGRWADGLDRQTYKQADRQ